VQSLENPPMVVFTTAYSQYAVDGFKLNALDYLLKPFGIDEFRRATKRLVEKHELLNAAAVSLVDEDDCIFLKTEYKIVRISIDDILYVEAMSEYLRIHFSNGARPVTALLSMKKMEERLPSNKFMRTHRSYIVNLKRIIEVNKSHIVMAPQVALPIGDLYKDTFMAYLNSKFLTK
jgi:DNA-binding LytR/AlgR family response regulator